MSEADAQEPQPVYRRVRLDRVRPMPNQPRRRFDPAALAALGLSLKQTGQRGQQGDIRIGVVPLPLIDSWR